MHKLLIEHTTSSGLLVLALHLAWPAAAAADPMPPGPFQKYDKGVVAWSKPASGFALLLAPQNPTIVEGGNRSVDIKARMDGMLLLKNVSKKTLTFQRKVLGAFQLKWTITDATGGKWVPTFLPPPMPRRGPPPKVHRLAPGKAAVLARFHGISGFRRAGKADDGRWYGVPPAGTYKVVARGIDLGTIKKRLTSGPMTIKVLPADRPVRGLKLQLRASSKETTQTRAMAGARPVKLELSFINVGKKAFTVDMNELAFNLLRPHVSGNHSYSRIARKKPPAPMGGLNAVTLKPGKRFKYTGLQAPGPLCGRDYRFSGPGWYEIRLEYTRKAPSARGYWTGKVSSNVIWLKVKP